MNTKLEQLIQQKLIIVEQMKVLSKERTRLSRAISVINFRNRKRKLKESDIKVLTSQEK